MIDEGDTITLERDELESGTTVNLPERLLRALFCVDAVVFLVDFFLPDVAGEATVAGPVF